MAGNCDRLEVGIVVKRDMAGIVIKIGLIFEVILLVILVLFLMINVYVISFSQDNIYMFADIEELHNSEVRNIEQPYEPYNAVIVLRGVADSQTGVSPIVYDRLVAAYEVYRIGLASEIVISGNHAETVAMKVFLVDRGVPPEDIVMDSRGFNTYYTMYRVKNEFNYNRVIIVGQKYQLYRTVYIGRMFGMDTIGVTSDFGISTGTYSRTFGGNLRESMARNRTFFDVEIFRRSSGVH